MPAKKTVILSFSLFLGGFSYHLLRGQSAPAADGIYSADQAHRGEALYQKQCVSCHGSMPWMARVRIRRSAGMTSSPNTRASPRSTSMT